MPIVRSPFSSWLITSNLSSILIFFRGFFTCITLDDASLHLPLLLVTNVNAVEGGTTSAV